MKLGFFLAVFLSQLFTINPSFAATPTVKFATPTTYDSGGSGANFVVAADLNGDGFPDMVVANTDGVSVRINNGDGTFGAATLYGTGGTNAFAVAVGDVNLDGIPDLVVTNFVSGVPGSIGGGVGVLIGNGDGTFQTAVSYDAGGLAPKPS
ncbi:MAG: VCBS repeat-containing protein [Candidatus Sulfotelmatobacter sp.]